MELLGIVMLLAAGMLMPVVMGVFMLDFRIVMPESRDKYFSKSRPQQIPANKNAARIFLRLITSNGPGTLDHVEFYPLVSARQRTLRACELAKDARGSCVQKPDQMRRGWQFRML